MQQGNYSVDMMKKQAFIHELNNYLKILHDDPKDTADKFFERQIIIDYFEQRIKEFDKRNK